MKKCYFCGATAPKIKKDRGVYKMHCSCGAKIEHTTEESVIDMWNYVVK